MANQKSFSNTFERTLSQGGNVLFESIPGSGTKKVLTPLWEKQELASRCP